MIAFPADGAGSCAPYSEGSQQQSYDFHHGPQHPQPMALNQSHHQHHHQSSVSLPSISYAACSVQSDGTGFPDAPVLPPISHSLNSVSRNGSLSGSPMLQSPSPGRLAFSVDNLIGKASGSDARLGPSELSSDTSVLRGSVIAPASSTSLHMHQRNPLEAMRELEKVPNSVASSNDGPVGIETFYGFISTPLDALMVVEGCRLGLLHTLDVRPREISDIVIRSGSVIVFDEAGSRMRRWRDNRKWSPSRVAGPFLLYKEIDTADSQRKSIAQMPTKCIPGVDPVFGAGVLRGDCRILDDGLTKKTMSVVMDDGKKYRVISYYLRSDVIEGRLVVPSKSPMLASIDPNSERLLNLLPLESRPQLGDSALPVGQAPHTKLDSEGPLPIGKRKQPMTHLSVKKRVREENSATPAFIPEMYKSVFPATQPMLSSKQRNTEYFHVDGQPQAAYSQSNPAADPLPRSRQLQWHFSAPPPSAEVSANPYNRRVDLRYQHLGADVSTPPRITFATGSSLQKPGSNLGGQNPYGSWNPSTFTSTTFRRPDTFPSAPPAITTSLSKTSISTLITPSSASPVPFSLPSGSPGRPFRGEDPFSRSGPSVHSAADLPSSNRSLAP